MSTKVEEFQRKLPEFLIYQIYKNKLRIYENTKKVFKTADFKNIKLLRHL